MTTMCSSHCFHPPSQMKTEAAETIVVSTTQQKQNNVSQSSPLNQKSQKHQNSLVAISADFTQ